MKPQRLWIVVAGVVLFALVLSRFVLHSPAGLKSSEVTSAKGRPAPSLKAMREQALPADERARERMPKLVVTNEPPAHCRALWQTLAERSIPDLREDLRRGVFQLSDDCLTFEPRSEFIRAAYAMCAYDSAHGELKTADACLGAIHLYRAFWVDRLTQDQVDYKHMSLTLLANKIMARFMAGLETEADRAVAKSMIQALIEREPNSPDARKAVVTISMTEFGKDNFDSDQFGAKIASARELKPNDSQLIEAELYVRTFHDEAGAAERYLLHHPDSELGYYYRGWESFKNGDFNAALADARRAARLAPHDTRIAQTVLALERGDKEGVFSMQMGFNLGDF